MNFLPLEAEVGHTMKQFQLSPVR